MVMFPLLKELGEVIQKQNRAMVASGMRRLPLCVLQMDTQSGYAYLAIGPLPHCTAWTAAATDASGVPSSSSLSPAGFSEH